MFHCSIPNATLFVRARGGWAPDIVRIRIIKQLTGSVDGIDLKPFQPGVIYEVSTTLGSYLLCVRVAEPAPDDGPAYAMPLGRVRTVAAHVGLEHPPEVGTRRTDPPPRREARRSRAKGK